MYSAQHASFELGDDSLGKLKTELEAYLIDRERVEIGDSLGEGIII